MAHFLAKNAQDCRILHTKSRNFSTGDTPNPRSGRGRPPRAPTPAQPLATLRHHTAQAARINTPLKLRVLIRRPRGLQLRRYDRFRGQLGGNGVGAAFDLKWPRHDGDLFELFEERQ